MLPAQHKMDNIAILCGQIQECIGEVSKWSADELLRKGEFGSGWICSLSLDVHIVLLVACL